MKLFILEHMPFILLYIFNLLILPLIYYNIGGFSSKENIFYFIFLSLFLLICFLIYRYIINKNMYENLDRKIDSPEDCLLQMGTSPIGIKLDIFLKKQYTVYQNQLQKYISKQKEHLTFINQWVHQMKTPLSVIQLIIQDGDFNNLNNIKTEVEKLNEGLNTALYLARMDTFENDFHIEPIDLNSLIYEVINDLKRLFIRKRVYPKVELKNNHKINCDTKWLKFILKQFLTNSIKYSNRENSKIFISSYEKNNKIILQVCDEGIGIPKCDIKRIFEPFYTGENGRKFGESTGVGLYIVKEVCNKLNLKLQVQSEIGKGTCIKVLF